MLFFISICSSILCLSSESMAGPRVSQSSGHSRWKQWWRRSPNTCCSKKILLLLVWQALFFLPLNMLVYIFTVNVVVLYLLTFLSFIFAPLIGWLADVRFGRYEVIKFGSITSFLASLLYYFALFNGGGDTTLNTVLSSVVFVIVGFGSTCYSAAMLPFLSDQIIGATSDELSTVVRWYCWVKNLGMCLSSIIFCQVINITDTYFGLYAVIIFAVPFAVIIISDCLCQQWLDKTHKVTNPIKLIIQVLNYTRKHSYPERRSAFTYIDEEQPTRMDYGKEKFGGPFTEEEVEDVKTVLRLLPLIICLSISISVLASNPQVFNDSICLLNFGIVPSFLLIPLYQLLLYRCFHSCSPSMLRCIGAGLFMGTLGYILLLALGVVGVIVSDDVQRYLSCAALAPNATNPGEWYWKIGPYILFSIGSTIVAVLTLEFIIASQQDKGLVIGIFLVFRGFIFSISIEFLEFTLCYDLPVSLVLVVLFVVFAFQSAILLLH